MKTYTITEADVARLKAMTDEAGNAVGRDIIHGIENQDGIADIHRNVMSTLSTRDTQTTMRLKSLTSLMGSAMRTKEDTNVVQVQRM